MNLVGQAILLLDWLILVFAVLYIATHFMQTLVQGATKGDIHFLKSAAHAKHRYAPINRCFDQG